MRVNWWWLDMCNFLLITRLLFTAFIMKLRIVIVNEQTITIEWVQCELRVSELVNFATN